MARLESPSGEKCTIRGCRRVRQARGLCHAHYVATMAGWEPRGPVKRVHRLTDEERAQVLALRRRGNGIKAIAQHLGVNRRAVQYLCQQHGLGGVLAQSR